MGCQQASIHEPRDSPDCTALLDHQDDLRFLNVDWLDQSYDLSRREDKDVVRISHRSHVMTNGP